MPYRVRCCSQTLYHRAIVVALRAVGPQKPLNGNFEGSAGPRLCRMCGDSSPPLVEFSWCDLQAVFRWGFFSISPKCASRRFLFPFRVRNPSFFFRILKRHRLFFYLLSDFFLLHCWLKTIHCLGKQLLWFEKLFSQKWFVEVALPLSYRLHKSSRMVTCGSPLLALRLRV